MLNSNIEYLRIKCDPISEKFAFYGTSFYFTTSLLYRVKSQWANRVSAISGECFWNYSDSQLDKQNN